MTIFQKKISMCSFFRIDIIITFIIAVLGICSGSAQQTNISLYYSTEGKVDYSIIGNSELTETGGTNNCGTDAATVSNLSLPAGSIILKAYVHWYALTYNPAKFSGYSALGNFKFKTPDGTNYTLDGTAYQGSTTFLSGTTYEGKKADVTSIIKGLSNANGSYTGDVTGGARFNLCPLSQENARAWTLTIVYADCSLTNNNKVYLYDGLFGLYSNAATIPITGYNVPTSGSTAGTMTSVTLQGDPNLSGEILSTSDAIFPNYPSDFANSSNGGALDIDALSGNFTAGTTSMNLDATTTGDVIIFGEFALKVSSVPVSPPLITAMENSCTPNDDKVQFGTAVNLVASGGVGYAWNNGLGSGSIKSVTPLFPTTYTVTVTDANGCTLTATKNISILVPPIASIAATETSCTANDNKILTGSSVGLTASAFGGGGGYTFTWNNSLGTGTTKSAAPSTTTPYTVTVSDANGCVSTANKIIEVVSAPLISINSTEGSCTPNDNNVLSGASVSLTITGGTSYSWSTGETTASITKTPSATTTYTVTATDANGCTNTASRTITVITTPTASITATESSCIANDDKILSGGSANLMGSASGGGGSFTYNWSNSLGTGVGPKSVSPTSTTIYTVTATDANGCTATASKTITIATNVTASIASTENSCIANDDKVLSGGTVNLTASGGATYTWSNSLGTGASKTATPQ